MTTDGGVPDRAARAFADHRAFEREDDRFVATTTPFDNAVRVNETDGRTLRYRVRVRVPMLSTAVAGEAVAPVVEDGWFETFERRLEDASMATRIDVPEPAVTRDGGEAIVDIAFEHGAPERAVEAAKALIEYVEGTYLEGIIPGYEYDSPVADLLAQARHSGNGDDRGPMPL